MQPVQACGKALPFPICLHGQLQASTLSAVGDLQSQYATDVPVNSGDDVQVTKV